MTIKTGCSASMIGLHEACQAVASNECSSAIVAGSSLIMTPTMTGCMSDNYVLSPDGECKTFDAGANGFARGEATNAVLIKRLDHALKDGDPIRAVIRATSTNCDGRTRKMAVPSPDAQQALIRKTYQQAGVDPSRTGLFECHGTGTAAGDVAETRAIANVFRQKGVVIGAVCESDFCF
jgi:acyl transferase domain-containing protein